MTQIIPWFPRFYATTTTGNSQRRYSPHAWTVTFARWQPLPTEVSGCSQLAGGHKVGRGYKCVSKQSGVYYVLYSLRSYYTLQTMLKPTQNYRSTFYAALPRGAALSVASRVSVRPAGRPSVRPCLRFSRNRKATETSNLVRTYRWTRVTRRANSKSKGKRSRSPGTKCKNRFSHISSTKLDRFTL